MEDEFAEASRDLDERILQYSKEQDSERFKAQRVYLSRVTMDFIAGVRAMWLAYTRYPENEKWLQQRFTDDFLESALSVWALAHQGIFNVCKREIRYLLEAAVKYVFVDQQVDGAESLARRLDLVKDKTLVPRSSVDPVDQTTFRMLSDPGAFTAAVHAAFGNLSGYTHMSRTQLDERIRRAERGEFTGFESAAVLEAFNRLLAQSYDLVLVLLMEGIGPSFTGDVFIQVFDPMPDWKFHKGRFVSIVSRSFDYKVERQR